MKERPILFSAPMVRAILDGTKTQTRRVIKGLALNWIADGFCPEFIACAENKLCPYGQPGDHLWVRETFLGWYNTDDGSFSHAAAYRADGYKLENGEKWRPSIHMPRAASRITLEITGVRVERLQDISPEDCLAEGIRGEHGNGRCDLTTAYADLWEQINGLGSWDANSWVWVVEFKRVEVGAA